MLFTRKDFPPHCDNRKEQQPVIFLPDESTPKCDVPSTKMSAFGYLAFVVSVINSVANAANNINNNQASFGSFQGGAERVIVKISPLCTANRTTTITTTMATITTTTT